jgi:aryl-alcohol dehydrogenase-like predicted oxidoreductase
MKLALGTVQFGLSYGVSNTHGKTTEQQALDILEYAWRSGINTLDTASGYGDSEKVIGRLVDPYKWNIFTKTPHFSGKKISKDQLKLLDIVFKQSLINLKRSNIDALLVHSAEDLLKPGGIQLFTKIQQLKELGSINKIGVSVYNYKQIDYLLDHYEIDIIQLPINILDQRLIKSGHLKKIKQHGIEIHARSVFLQGLLLMPLHKLPAYFSKIYGNLEKFMIYAHELSLSNIELALGFVQSIEEVDKVIIGVNTVDQLYKIIDASKVKVNQNSYFDLAVFDTDYTNPSNWRL